MLVEGNTDNVPISRTNIRNNWDLSALRASSVVPCLQNDFGINPSRLSAAGRGEFNPIADNDTEVGKQRNRRTELIITPKLDQFLDLIDQAPKEDWHNIIFWQNIILRNNTLVHTLNPRFTPWDGDFWLIIVKNLGFSQESEIFY